jgi:hypothetical protein
LQTAIVGRSANSYSLRSPWLFWACYLRYYSHFVSTVAIVDSVLLTACASDYKGRPVTELVVCARVQLSVWRCRPHHALPSSLRQPWFVFPSIRMRLVFPRTDYGTYTCAVLLAWFQQCSVRCRSLQPPMALIRCFTASSSPLQFLVVIRWCKVLARLCSLLRCGPPHSLGMWCLQAVSAAQRRCMYSYSIQLICLGANGLNAIFLVLMFSGRCAACTVAA